LAFFFGSHIMNPIHYSEVDEIRNYLSQVIYWQFSNDPRVWFLISTPFLYFKTTTFFFFFDVLKNLMEQNEGKEIIVHHNCYHCGNCYAQRSPYSIHRAIILFFEHRTQRSLYHLILSRNFEVFKRWCLHTFLHQHLNTLKLRLSDW